MHPMTLPIWGSSLLGCMLFIFWYHTHSSKIRCKACPIRCKACPNAKSFIASRASLAFTVNSQPSSSKSFTMSSQDTGCTLAIHYEHTLPMAADGFREVSLASIGTMCGWLSVFIRSASLVLGTSLELSAWTWVCCAFLASGSLWEPSPGLRTNITFAFWRRHWQSYKNDEGKWHLLDGICFKARAG